VSKLKRQRKKEITHIVVCKYGGGLALICPLSEEWSSQFQIGQDITVGSKRTSATHSNTWFSWASKDASSMEITLASKSWLSYLLRIETQGWWIATPDLWNTFVTNTQWLGVAYLYIPSSLFSWSVTSFKSKYVITVRTFGLNVHVQPMSWFIYTVTMNYD
jgi:hypothetical protein